MLHSLQRNGLMTFRKEIILSLLLLLPFAEKAHSASQASLENPILHGGQETITPSDRPGAAGTALPNTFWVDSHYAPKDWFITQDTTWNVCHSGCAYSSPLEAWHAALRVTPVNGARLTIHIADGTYDINDQMITEVPYTKSVWVIGNEQDPTRVVLNFTNTKGTNGAGFGAYDGGMIGMINGVTIQTPTDGSGAADSTDAVGHHRWHSQSYGSGIFAYGAGSSIQLGNQVIIHGFYYSLTADNNGGIDAPHGGVRMSFAGDVNAMARGGGVIVCTPCTATDANDYTSPPAVLGSNFDAERGGSLYIDGSTGSNTLEAGLLGLTGGHIWAHNLTLTGSIQSGSPGALIASNATAELNGSHISGYNIGVNAFQGGFAAVDDCVISNNSDSGIVADAGRINGSHVTVKNNAKFGVHAFHSGSITLFSSNDSINGNGVNISADGAGTLPNGSSWPGSTVAVQ